MHRKDKANQIAVIAFDLDTERSYRELSAINKIKLIKRRIQNVCELLKKEKPKATWIFVWREYGIFDINSRSISNIAKQSFKKQMKLLSLKYPNLIIIGGTVATRKKLQGGDLGVIKSYYDSLKLYEEIEDKDEYLCNQIQYHKDDIEDLEGCDVIAFANKARVFFHGEEKKHGKLTPYSETIDKLNGIFQPAKGKNLSPILDIKKDPLNIRIGIEICREHLQEFKVLQQYMIDKAIKDKPLLHFVLSNTISLDLDSACASYAVIHVDSHEDNPPVLTRDHHKHNIDFSYYKFLIMQPIKQLNRPVTPVYPLQYRLLDKIDTLTKEVSDANVARLKKLANQIVKSHSGLGFGYSHKIRLEDSISAMLHHSFYIYSTLMEVVNDKSITKRPLKSLKI